MPLSMLKPLLQGWSFRGYAQTFLIVENSLEDARTAFDDLDEVILFVGSTRIRMSQ